MNTLTNWLLAIPLSLLLGALGIALDGEDRRDEMRVFTELDAAQKQSAALMRREIAGRAVCRERHGEADARWDDQGNLICRPRKFKEVAAL